MPRAASILIPAAACLVAAAPALADATNTARVIISPDFSGGAGPIDTTVSHTGTCDNTGSTTGGFSSAGAATAHVEYGSIRLTGSGTVSINATAIGIVRDTITITAPGVPTGTNGTLTYSVRVSGNVQATSGSSGATWNAQTNLDGGPFEISKTATSYSPSLGGAYVGNPFGVSSATVGFQFGVPRALYIELRGTADSANASTTNIGEAHFGGPLSLDWLGMTNLTANGSPIGSFSVASESGTNWGGDLTPVTCDSIDFNGDDLFPDTQDIDEFLSVFSGGACSTGTCGDIDFNNDGLFPDTSDIDSLLSVFSGGPCL